MKAILILLAVAIGSAGCSPQPPPDGPTNSDTPVQSPIYAPRPGDADLERGPVYLESAEILTMESFPLQFAVLLRGSLATTCHELRVVFYEPDEDNRLKLDVYSVSDPNALCAQALEPFEQNVFLGSFPSGHYTVWVNDEHLAEFDA